MFHKSVKKSSTALASSICLAGGILSAGPTLAQEQPFDACAGASFLDAGVAVHEVLTTRERRCYLTQAEEIGLLAFEVTVPANAEAAPRLFGPWSCLSGVAAPEDVTRRASGAMVTVIEPGLYGFCVGVQNPSHVLGNVAIQTAFARRLAPTPNPGDPREEEPEPDTLIGRIPAPNPGDPREEEPEPDTLIGRIPAPNPGDPREEEPEPDTLIGRIPAPNPGDPREEEPEPDTLIGRIPAPNPGDPREDEPEPDTLIAWQAALQDLCSKDDDHSNLADCATPTFFNALDGQIESAHDHDFFSFSLESLTTLRIVLSGFSESLSLELRDEAGSRLRVITSGSDIVRAFGPGRYTLNVTGTAGATYRLAVLPISNSQRTANF